MRAVNINEAEIVLEPFWDGSTSDFEDKDIRYRVLDEYEITTQTGAIAGFLQNWAFAEFQIDKASEDSAALIMKRDCLVDISGYDRFIVFGSFPKNTQLRVSGVLDGKLCEILAKTRGMGDTTEYTGNYVGGTLTQLTLEVYAEGAANGNVGWFGAANKAKLEEMLSHKSPYTPEWKGFFEEKAVERVPQTKLLFAQDDLPALREKLGGELFKSCFAAKREAAKAAMQIIPEEYVGRFVPTYDKRWCRARDINIGNIPSIMENLAFVGLIDNNEEMLKMACRHLLAICHCEYWCEAMVGVFPGATWHHRSFTESCYAKAAALVLDWAGSLLTPFAKQVVYDALALKGLPRMESDFHRVEYIRGMNQGIVFSNGRIFALLALIPRYPRYESLLLEAEGDLVSMVERYIQQDGGTLEGPGYWMFTFRESMSVFYALARKKNVALTYYKDLFKETAAFALGLMSMEDDGTEVLAINDAHPASHMSCALASCFYAFTGDMRWGALCERLLLKKRMEDDVFALVCVPKLETLTPETQTFISAVFPKTGQLGSTRCGEDLQTHVHYCSGLSYRGHYHQDKGSIIIEANGTALVPDFGTGFYYDSDLHTLTNPSAHSLLLPIYANGKTAHQHANEPKGTILFAEASKDIAHFYADETATWADEPYKLMRRRVLSPFAELVLIADEYALDTADSVAFVLNGSAPYSLEAQKAVMSKGGVSLSVIPLNWQWAQAQSVKRQDGEHREVYQLFARVGTARKGFLITAICLEKDVPFAFEQTADGYMVQHGKTSCYIEIDEQSKIFTIKEKS